MPISAATRLNLPSLLALTTKMPESRTRIPATPNKRLDHHGIEDFAHLFLMLSIVLYFDAYLNVRV